MKCLITSCKGKDNCLQHCPCDCHLCQRHKGIMTNFSELCSCEKKKDYTLSYEIIALMFYNDTGLMAPGKSVAPQMMDSRYQDGSRETAWQKWQELNKAHIKAVMELV